MLLRRAGLAACRGAPSAATRRLVVRRASSLSACRGGAPTAATPRRRGFRAASTEASTEPAPAAAAARVYEGPLNDAVKRVRIVSLTTLTTSLLLPPMALAFKSSATVSLLGKVRDPRGMRYLVSRWRVANERRTPL